MGSKFDFPHFVMHVQHLHVVYLMIPSAADVIQHRILRQIMNNQQDGERAGLTQIEGLYWHFHERTEKNYETPDSE
jgi:D-alanyl-D-alanine dipeptidase